MSKESNLNNLKFIFFTSLLFLTINTQDSQKLKDLYYLNKLSNTKFEKEAIKLINEMIYRGITFISLDSLKLMHKRHWQKSVKLLLDYMQDLILPEVQEEIYSIIRESNEYLGGIKSWLKDKKKNIATISPVFEWSQDNELVKIRLKFSKSLESPGEKDIQNFKVECKRSFLIVHGYKVHESEAYVAYYYRKIRLYDYIRHITCNVYKETDGSYIIKFEKNQPTLYWNFLDLTTEDHHNMFTWFDVFTQYEDKAKYTEFRDFAMQNLLEKDINDYVKANSEEKKLRLTRIKRLFRQLETKEAENKNFCNSPVNEHFCILNDIYNWNYWLS